MITDSIAVHFKPTAGDFRRVLIWYQWKRLALVFGITTLVFVLLGFYVANAKPTNPRDDKRPVLLATFVVMPFFILGAVYSGIRRQAKRNGAIAEDTQFTLGNTGIEATTASTSVRMNWERFNKITETSQYFVFFPQANIFYPIPKRAFDGEDQIQLVRSLISANLGDKAKLRV